MHRLVPAILVISSAKATDENTTSEPIERSMPAAMMTNVMPPASTRISEVSSATLVTLSVLRNVPLRGQQREREAA